ncbi:MAG: hypothetical protein J7K73_01795 [Nanoarchaeota archaeon]|nr:hypothetical protein [Nanoarchaeota archaeon]
MKSKIFLLGIVLVLSFAATNALDYMCDATGLGNPVTLPENTDKAWVVPVEYSKIPLVIPFDGRPVIVPINDSAIFIVPFEGERPEIHFVHKIITIPYKVFDDLKITNNKRAIFIPLENETLLVTLHKDYIILPHGDELAPIIGTTTEHVDIDHAIIIPVWGLANEPIIAEINGDNLIVSLEGGGGGGGIYLRGGEDPVVFQGTLRATDSLVTYVGYTPEPMFIHLIDSDRTDLFEFTDTLIDIRTCCAI